MMVHASRHEGARALDAEHSLQQGKAIHDTLDQSLEQHTRTHDAIKDTGRSVDDMHEGITDKLGEVSDKIIEGLKPPEIQKVQLHVPDDETETDEEEADEQDQANSILKGMVMLRGKRGPKGDQGEKHTDEEITALLRPMLPEILEELKPTDEELLALIKPLIPEVKDGEAGEDGEDGETPSDERLLALVSPLVERMMPSEKELLKIIKPLIPKLKETKVPSITDIIAALKGKLAYDDLEGKPNLDTFRSRLGGTGYLKDITDIDLANLMDGQALVYSKSRDKWYPATLSGGGGGGYTYVEVPAGDLDGVNTVFTLAHVPTQPSLILVNLNGAIQTQLGGSPDYAIAGDTITFTSPPDGSSLTVYYS